MAFIDTMELISGYQKRGHYSRPNTIFTDRLFPRYHVVIKFYVEMWSGVNIDITRMVIKYLTWYNHDINDKEQSVIWETYLS